MSVLSKSIFKGLSGATLFFVVACKPLPYDDVSADEVKLITRIPHENPVNMETLILGRLWIVDHCVTIGESAEDSRTTIWRDGYRVGKDSKGLFVHHPTREKRHRVGEKVRFGGGYVETMPANWIAESIVGGNMEGCPEPFIFVDTTGDG